MTIYRLLSIHPVSMVTDILGHVDQGHPQGHSVTVEPPGSDHL